MSHKLLEKIDDIVADNRITEDEYIIICNLLKRIHDRPTDILINNLREEIDCLREENECIENDRIYKLFELNRIYKSREVMKNLNRQLHKDLKNVRDKSKQDIADKIIEISHLKKELKDLTIKYNNLNPNDTTINLTHAELIPFELSDNVNCCCGSNIKRSGLSKHLKTKKHLAHINKL